MKKFSNKVLIILPSGYLNLDTFQYLIEYLDTYLEFGLFGKLGIEYKQNVFSFPWTPKKIEDYKYYY